MIERSLIRRTHFLIRKVTRRKSYVLFTFFSRWKQSLNYIEFMTYNERHRRLLGFLLIFVKKLKTDYCTANSDTVYLKPPPDKTEADKSLRDEISQTYTFAPYFQLIGNEKKAKECFSHKNTKSQVPTFN